MECRYVPENKNGFLHVRAQSRTATQIASIAAIAFQYGSPDDALAAQWLEGVARLPYTGSEPDRAAWLKQSISTGGSTNIGGVAFRLYGTSGTRTLEITAPAGR